MALFPEACAPLFFIIELLVLNEDKLGAFNTVTDLSHGPVSLS
jgi:hypothetical protein